MMNQSDAENIGNLSLSVIILKSILVFMIVEKHILERY